MREIIIKLTAVLAALIMFVAIAACDKRSYSALGVRDRHYGSFRLPRACGAR